MCARTHTKKKMDIEAIKEKIVEVPFHLPERDGEGLCSVGITGETDYASMQDRKTRIDRIKARDDWRETITCDRCGNCLEFRGFSSKREEITIGLYCLNGEFETTSYHTCNHSRMARNNRRKVVYDMRNAPLGFAEGLSKLQLSSPMKEKLDEIKLERTIPIDGYKGGSEYYKRADGEKEAEGSGKVPKSLAN